MKRRRVVVLGGGCGGVAAAWALTRDESMRRRFEVTLVQAGHRLGGKGATGRDPDRGHAVLEHGLHLWLGFYDEAFSMVRDLYDAWDGPSEGPQRSLPAAFAPLRDVALCGGDDDAPEIWRMRFPEARGLPWDRERGALDLVSMASRWVREAPSVLVADGSTTQHLARVATMADLALAVLRGLLSERARHGAAMFDAMNAVELRAWLRAHGASSAAADSPPIRALYDLGFAYPDGVAGAGRGLMAAGAGVRVLIQIFAGYRGAPFWRMNAGMGDTVFAPAYEVLRDRGVAFRFFRRVEDVGVSDGRVDRIRLAIQARGERGYDPLIRVGPTRAWPSAPIAASLEAVCEGNLEADRGGSLGVEELRVDRDFDDVVLAIPSTAHPIIASALMSASPRFRAMVEHTHGVPTIAAQWWLARSPAQLGWRGPRPVLTGLPGLFRTWAELGEVVDAEAWAERPSSLAYFCNVAPPELHGTTDSAAAAAHVRTQMRAWASGPLASVWPDASAPGGGFDEGALHAEGARSGWDTQYARANVQAWERYILTLPGTVEHRLRPGASGFDNLVLAGDWTRNTIDGGSVEGAVSSGIEAARVLARRHA